MTSYDFLRINCQIMTRYDFLESRRVIAGNVRPDCELVHIMNRYESQQTRRVLVCNFEPTPIEHNSLLVETVQVNLKNGLNAYKKHPWDRHVEK